MGAELSLSVRPNQGVVDVEHQHRIGIVCGLGRVKFPYGHLVYAQNLLLGQG
jgi:hypothetical protein